MEEMQSGSDEGSIDKAINGEYEFTIGGVLKEAWERTKGAKWTFQIAFFYYFLVFIAVVLLVTGLTIFIFQITQDEGLDLIVTMALQVVQNLIFLPLSMGIAMLGIKRSIDAPIEAESIFNYYGRMWSLLGTLILMYVMITIGLILLIIPGIYLAVAYYMAMPLVVEKKLSPWRALETSRKAVTKRWFSVFGLAFALGLIVTISAIPLGLGLIWTLPMMIIALGILYRNMFGVEEENRA